MNKRPNILLITADQMRWDCLACAGNPVIRTPNLDALAARGVLFENAFTPNPICVPGRASIMTGNYSHTCTGCKNNGGRIREDQPLLTEVLKSVGYRTYALGKLHFVPYAPPGQPRLVHGFEHVDLTESGRILNQYDPQGKLRGLEDYFDYLQDVGWGGYTRAHGIGNNDVRPCPTPLPKEHTVDHWIADCTLRQLDRHAGEFPEQPFFMWMSSPKPHSPYDPPQPYDTLYDPRQVPAPFGAAEHLAGRCSFIEKTRITHGMDTLSPASLQVIRSYYYGCITWLDEQIGRVIRRLEEMEILDNTLIIFSADHGDLLGDFGSFFKCNHLNGSVRVPFIACGPGVAASGKSRALVGLQDILPTFAAAGGADIGQDVHGHDLTPILRDPGATVRDWYYAQSLGSPNQTVMITDGKWKYIYSEAGGIEELYDQVNDPGELNNLAHDSGQAERVRGMRERLSAMARELGDTEIFDNDGLAVSTLDRREIRELPISGLGWRWY